MVYKSEFQDSQGCYQQKPCLGKKKQFSREYYSDSLLLFLTVLTCLETRRLAWQGHQRSTCLGLPGTGGAHMCILPLLKSLWGSHPSPKAFVIYNSSLLTFLYCVLVFLVLIQRSPLFLQCLAPCLLIQNLDGLELIIVGYTGWPVTCRGPSSFGMTSAVVAKHRQNLDLKQKLETASASL